jgi:glycosyltransferase involved in cell wall biosynthesis
LLSICIPTFNTDCSELLDILAKQIAQLEETLEVLVYDDFSTDYVCKNQEACERNGFLFFENQSNLGSILTRIKLAKKSSFNWLLFVDADMLPKTDEYIIQYTNFITFNKADIAIGGCCYADEIKPFNLRLKYGKNREEISAKKRQLNPYNSILFGNVLIKKKLFNEVFDDFNDMAYGEDIYLSSFLKSLNKDVVH